MAQSLASAGESPPLNSLARGEMIREAVRHITSLKAKADAVNREIREYKFQVIRGNLGFKLVDFEAIYRVSQLEVADRDELLYTMGEAFQALGIGQVVDWVDVAQRTPRGATNGAGDTAPRRGRGRPRKPRPEPEAGAEA